MAAVATNSQPKRRISRTGAWVAALTLVLLLFSVPYGMANELEPVHGTPPAAALDIKDLDDRHHRLQDYSGQVILVNFWATWCPPCVAEMPGLERLKKAFSGQPFEVLAVNLGEGLLRVQNFKNTSGLDFPFLLDKESKVAERWGVSFLPTSFLIDAQGRLRYKAYGELAWDDAEVRATVETLLKEAFEALIQPNQDQLCAL